MAKYKLTINDEDNVLINTIPAQPEDGFEEGTKVTINVKYGPVGNLFGAIDGGTPVEIIPKAVFEVVMDADKNVILTKQVDSSVAAPVITPNGGSVDHGSKVAITCATEGAKIFYTTDGSNPTSESTPYEESLTIADNVTIKAIAYLEDEASAIASAEFTISEPAPKAATPTINTDLHSTAEIPAEPGTLDLTIEASTSDEGTLSYQWYKDNVAIEGAVNTTLTVSEAGAYKCVITNTLGEDTATASSTVCTVTVA